MPRLPLFLARLAIPLAAFVGMRALGSGGGGNAELALLSLIAGVVLVAVAELSPTPAAELGGGALAVTLLVLALPAGAGRGAVVMAVLLATLAIAAGRRFLRDGARMPLSAAVALALATQFLARGDLLVEPGLGLRTALVLLVLPAIAAAAICALATHAGSRAWIAAALLAAGGGLRGVAVITLVGLVALAIALRPALAPRARMAAWGASGGAVFALVVAQPAPVWPLVLASAALVLPARTLAVATAISATLGLGSVLTSAYPWLRANPAPAALRLLAVHRPGRQVLPEETTLDATDSRLAIAIPALSKVPASRISVRSTLTDSLALSPDSPVMNLTVEAANGEHVDFVLRAGQETGEWAARRPDVVQLGLRAPAAWRSVAESGFFAQEYRASFTLPRPLEVVAIRIDRSAVLPTEVRCVVHAVELR